MKFVVGLIIAVLGGALIGFGAAKALASQRRMSSGSVAGETLTRLSFALELEKEKAGAYPDSISRLQISGGGEFSQTVLQRVVYRRTTNGYVAFVGHPGVVYIEPGSTAQFE